MKKRIVFQFFMLLIFTLHIRAMENLSIDKSQNPSVPVNDICYFFTIPIDICNYIKRFLVWEFKAEYIKRTQKIKKVPDEYCKRFISDITSRCISPHNDRDEVIVNDVFSPDETKFALFELTCGACKPPKLMIFDIQKDREEEKILYNGQLTQEHYCALGLSTSGNIIAVIKRQETVSNNNCHIQSYYDVLTIQKMVKKEEKQLFEEIKRFSIPEGFVPQQLDFNKQNSHLIMYGYNRKKIFKPTNISFLLQDFTLKDKVTLQEKPIFVEDEKNELLNYFKYKGICNNIEKSKL